MSLGILAAATTAAAGAADFKRCGKADVGYTRASVQAEGIGCRRARRFVYRWARADYNCSPANNYCEVTRRKGFRCVKGGGELFVQLRCKRGDQVIRARWGD